MNAGAAGTAGRAIELRAVPTLRARKLAIDRPESDRASDNHSFGRATALRHRCPAVRCCQRLTARRASLTAPAGSGSVLSQ